MSKQKSIWLQSTDLDDLNQRGHNTMASHLGIVFLELGQDYLVATMPVDERTRQPLGILNGGASAALTETLASTAANFCVSADYYCVGTHVEATHVRPVRQGMVIATAKPLHLGRSTQLWEVLIRDPQQRLICAARMSMMCLARKKEG